MSLKAIHYIYSFSEAPERESSWSTADTTLKIVKNIQFGNNFTLIYRGKIFSALWLPLFFPLWVSQLLVLLPLPEGSPLHASSGGHNGRSGAVSLQCGWWRPRRKDTHLSSWWEHLLHRTTEEWWWRQRTEAVSDAALSVQHRPFSRRQL